MTPENEALLSQLKSVFIENAQLKKALAGGEANKDAVSFSAYRSVIIALRRAHNILEDMLPSLPKAKRTDAQIYLKLLGDMQSDVSVYANIGFLEEFVRPVGDPYPNTYPLMNASAPKSSRGKKRKSKENGDGN